MKDPIRFLCMTKCLDGITQPVKTTKRVKYQCVETSSSYICIGASTGSIYVFDRSTGKLIKFISNKLNGIILMKFSTNAKLLAVADSTGLVTVWELEEQTHNFKVVKEIEDFNGHVITSLCWSDSFSRVFIGDAEGKVMSFSLGFSSFGIASVELLRKTGESVVQMDFCNGKLLISMKNKAIIYNEDRTNFDQIGTKSRDGAYGSCFLKEDVMNTTPVIYSARPGSRLWEVDFVGNVLATHQFKELLAEPPSPIITSSNVSLPESNQSWSHPQAFNFPTLYPIMSRYLLTWSPRGIYLFEPRTGNVAAWNDQILDIVGISTSGYDMYFLHSDCSVTEVSLLTTKECLFTLRKMEEWEKLVTFACFRQDEIFDDVESFIAIGFHDILCRFKETLACSEDSALKMEEFIKKLEEKHAEVRAKVEEKLNQMWTLTENAPSESPVAIDDTDDVMSDVGSGGSGGGSGGSSSKRSLTMMSEISLNSFWQKATNIVASKVISSGFMKKSLQDALEAEGVFLDIARNFPERKPIHVEQKEYHSAPTSPKLSPRKCGPSRLLEAVGSPTKAHSFSNLSGRECNEGTTSLLLEAPTSPPKSLSFSNLPQADDTTVDNSGKDILSVPSDGKSTRRKKKVKVIDINSPNSRDSSSTHNTFKHDVDPPISDGKNVAVFSNVTSSVSPMKVTHNKPLEASSFIVKPLQCEITKEFSPTNDVVESGPKEITTDSIIDKEVYSSLSLSPKTCDFFISLPSDVSSLVNKLVNTTAATRNGIRDPGVLYNSKAIKDLLLRWANQSAKIEKEFRKECFKNLPQPIQDNVTPSFLSGFEVECRKLFFAQLSSAFGEVSNVAMLCFETNIYPNQCSSLRNHEVSLLNLDTTLDEIYKNTREEWKTLKEFPIHTKDDNIVVQNMLDVEEERFEENIEVEPDDCDELTASTQYVIISSSTEMDNSSSDIETSKSERGQDDRKISESRLDQISVSTVLSKSDVTDLDMILEGSESDIGELNENPLLCENFNIHEDTECNLCYVDKCRACFVLRYFPVLNFTRMRSLLLWNGGCRWRTWLACMVHLRDIYKSTKISDLFENDCMSSSFTGSEHNIKVLFGCIPRFYDTSPELVLECISDGAGAGALNSWEITLLYQTEFMQNSCINDFLHYSLTQLSSSRMDPLFAINTLHSALMFQPSKSHLFCSCGKARPGSHTVQWKRQDLLLKLVANVNDHYMPNDKEMVMRFSIVLAKNGFWLGYIHMVGILGDINDVLTLTYQLGDYSLLNDLIVQGIVLPSDDLWEIQFEKICQDMEDNVDHSCKPLEGFVPSLTLKKLIEVAATHSGSKFVLAMMNKFRNHNILPTDIYLSLVKAAELENKQEGLVSKLIEVASAKLWSEKKNTLHPQFELIKMADLEGLESSPISPNNYKSNPYVMEECDTVWGRSINISTAECPVCTLPLCLKTMSSSTAGLIVFQCGHSFHKVCLPETACLVCFHDNFTSLY